MVGQEFEDHLDSLDQALSKLMKSYLEYKTQNSKKPDKEITLFQHSLFLCLIIFIIIAVTCGIGSLFLEDIIYLLYIACIQVFLAIMLYIYFVRKIGKQVRLEKAKGQEVEIKLSSYELDQIRFNMLQELARSPIPANLITPSTIKRMKQLVFNRKCHSLEECIAYIKKEPQPKKQREELEQIKYLQTISFH